MVKGFADTVDEKTDDLREIITKHAESVKSDSWFVRSLLAEADEASKRIRENLDYAVSEWKESQSALADERRRFEKACRQFDNRLELRGVLGNILGLIGAFGFGVLTTIYFIKFK